MEYRPLGRTGEQVSVVSLGSGGQSRLGQVRGASSEDMVLLVRTAHEMGINLFDSAPAYGDSEEILGRALRDVERGSYLLATKVTVSTDGRLHDEDDLDRSVTRSLQHFGTGHIDLLQLHGVQPQDYRAVLDRLLPVLETRRERGDVRFIGITEAPNLDPIHTMLEMALDEGRFDAIMVAYNLLCPSAERVVFPLALATGTGVIAMIAVRRTLADRVQLERRLADAKARGVIAEDALPEHGPLDWLLQPGRVDSVASAAYKFSAAHPAVATVLTGTGNVDHLRANVAAVLGDPLPSAHLERLQTIFGAVEEALFT